MKVRFKYQVQQCKKEPTENQIVVLKKVIQDGEKSGESDLNLRDIAINLKNKYRKESTPI